MYQSLLQIRPQLTGSYYFDLQASSSPDPISDSLRFGLGSSGRNAEDETTDSGDPVEIDVFTDPL